VIAAKYVGAALIGAVTAALAFLIVLSLFELEVTDKSDSGASAPQGNLITNPSAEPDTTDWGTTEATLTAARASAPDVDGSHVFRLTRTAAGGGTVSAFAPDIAVSQGDEITASALIVSIPGSLDANVGIDWKTAEGAYISSPPDAPAVSDDGSRATVTGAAPPGAGRATVTVNFLLADEDQSLEFDDVQAEIVSGD
jgi:hypothetical protein